MPYTEMSNSAQKASRRYVLLGFGGAAVAGTAFAKVALAGTAPDAPLTAASFAPYVSQTFLVTGDDQRTALKLVEVQKLPRGSRPRGMPNPFSLIFQSLNDKPLPAQTYSVVFSSLGVLSMFITPVDKRGVIYEAAFN